MAEYSRPSSADVVQAVEHFMVEAVAAFTAEGRYSEAFAMTDHLKTLRIAFPKPEFKHPWNLTDDERKLCLGGNIINCIKEVRHRTGLGLKEAKDLVEAFLSHHMPEKYVGYGGPFKGKVSKLGEVDPTFPTTQPVV